jgi:hypothetical protein
LCLRLCLGLALLLGGCSTSKPAQEPEDAIASQTDLPAVMVPVTELDRAEVPTSETRALDIGLVVFDPGLPKDENRGRELGIFPEIRNAEASFLPYALREVLVESQHWGAVRVLPDADTSTELLVQGRILRSDGARLDLEIRAEDPSGRSWLHQVYSARSKALAVTASGTISRQQQPFQDLYNRIANDLHAVSKSLDDRQLQQIRETGFLRYASTLAPEAFAGYLQSNPAGGYSYQRLPSNEDPMVQRIRRVRAQEFLFIDTMDDQYFELYSAMAPTYELWRQYNREQVLYQEDKQERLKQRESEKEGTYLAMKDSYNRYRWAKLQQEELQELAKGFDNEVAPTAVELEGRVVKLNGSLEDRYLEWRRILRQIYELETGPVPSGGASH